MLKKWVEFTTGIGCPNNCVYCPQNLLIEQYFKTSPNATTILGLNDFKTILEKIPKSLQIIFSGMSEPFLNPQTTEMVLHAHNQGYHICIYTTLRGLSIENLKRIINIPFDEFCIHTPDADKILDLPVDKEYLDKVELLKKSNISNLSYMTIGRPRKDIADIAQKEIFSRDMFSRGDSLDKSQIPQQLQFLPQDVKSSKRFFCDRQLFTLKWHATLPRLETILILPDGRVTLCCMDYGLKHILGNILQQSYEEIINGTAMKHIEDAMCGLNSDYIICRSCEQIHRYSRLSLEIYRLTGIYKDNVWKSLIRLPLFLLKKIF